MRADTRPHAGTALLRARRLTGVDAAFVREEVREGKRRPAVRRAARAFRWGRRWVRGGALALIALVAGLTVVVGGYQQEALAWKGSHKDEIGLHLFQANTWCSRGKDLTAEEPSSGLISGNQNVELDVDLEDLPPVANPRQYDIAIQREIAKARENLFADQKTTWSQRGIAGTYWTTYGQDCFTVANTVVRISDFVFLVPRYAALLTITFFQWSIDGQIVNQFLGDSSRDETPLDVIVDATSFGLLFELLSLVIVVAALVMFWRAVIKGEGLADFLSKFVIMILVAAFLFFFTNNATFVLGTLNNATNGLVGSVFSAFSSATCRALPGATKEECQETTADDKLKCPDSNPENRLVETDPIDCIAQVFYHALVFVPWATGQIGTLSNDAQGQKNHYFAYKILEYQSFTNEEVFRNSDFDPTNDIIEGRLCYSHNWSPEYADDKVGDYDCNKDTKKNLREALLIEVGGDPQKSESWGDYEGPVNADKTIPDEPERVIHLDDNWQTASHSQLTQVVPTQNKGIFASLSGVDYSHKLSTAVMALIGTCLLCIMLFILAAAYLILQIASLVLAMVAPIAILVGLIPGVGFRAFLRWAELFIGTFLRRIGLAIFVGLIMALYTFILTLG